MARRASAVRIDPEDPLGLPVARLIAWYRVDVTSRVAAALMAAIAVLSIGSVAITSFVANRAPRSATVLASPRWPIVPHASSVEAEVAFGLLGLTFALIIGLLALVVLPRILVEERYLALRVDGLLWVDGANRRYATWDDIEHAEVEQAGVRIDLRSGEHWVLNVPLAGIDWRELAMAICTTRRRALFGLYR